MTNEFDVKDYKLLYELSQNARMPYTQLAKKVGLSKNAVAYRVDRLRKKGVIERFLVVINHKLVGYSVYDVFFKLKLKDEERNKVEDYFKKHPNFILVHQLSGEWDYVVELACKSIQEFFRIISEMTNYLSPYIDTYKTYMSIDAYKVEFIPHDICEKIGIKHVQEISKTVTEDMIIKIDDFDKKLLFILSKESTMPVLELAKTLNKAPETVLNRIHSLVNRKIISKFSILVDYEKLGYSNYAVLLDLRNLTKERLTALKAHIVNEKNVRYAFQAASSPEIVMKVLVQDITELDSILRVLKEKFYDVVVNYKYMLVSKQICYDQFPKGLF